MRVKQNRATYKTCKTCCFKNNIKCTFFKDVEKEKELGKVVNVYCYSKVDVDWYKEEEPLLFKQNQKNWQRMHRKEHLKIVRKRTLDNIAWEQCWKEIGGYLNDR